MENGPLTEKDIISMRSSMLMPKNEFALQFEPGASRQHIDAWVTYYVQQAEKAQNRLGRQTNISVDSMRIQNDGLVTLAGPNIGAIGNLKEVRNQVAATQMGGEVMEGEIQLKPKGPPPRIPSDSIITKGIGQTLILKETITRKIR